MHTNSGNRAFHVTMCRHRASGCSSHSSPSSKAVWFHGCGTLRCGQAHSGTLRNPLKRSASISIQPSTRVLTATTVSSATTAPRATSVATAQRLDALLRFPSPNPPTFREEPKNVYKPQNSLNPFEEALRVGHCQKSWRKAQWKMGNNKTVNSLVLFERHRLP